MSLLNRVPKSKPEDETLKQKIINSVLAQLQVDESGMTDNIDILREKILAILNTIPDIGDKTHNDDQLQALYTAVIHEIIGYGPLQPLLDDDTITEILVLPSKRVFIRRNGGDRESANVQFDDGDHVLRIADRLIAGIRKHVIMNRWIRARLSNEWIVNVDWFTQEGLNDVGWQTLQLRRMRPPMLTPEEHIEREVLTQEMLTYLQTAVAQSKRIIVGGTDNNAVGGLVYLLSGFLEEHIFAVAVEDIYKIALAAAGIVKMRLPQRPHQDIRQLGTHEADVADFIPQVQQLRPDVLIVSELNTLTCASVLWAATPYIGTLHSRSPEYSAQWLTHHGGLTDVAKLANCTDVIVQMEAPYRLGSICEIDANTPRVLRTIFTYD